MRFFGAIETDDLGAYKLLRYLGLLSLERDLAKSVSVLIIWTWVLIAAMCIAIEIVIFSDRDFRWWRLSNNRHILVQNIDDLRILPMYILDSYWIKTTASTRGPSEVENDLHSQEGQEKSPHRTTDYKDFELGVFEGIILGVGGLSVAAADAVF